MYIVNGYIIIDISLYNKCEKVINKQALGFYLTSEPNTVIDITSCFDQKLAAMALHSSQFSGETLALYRLYFMEKGRLQLMPQFHRECEKKASVQKQSASVEEICFSSKIDCIHLVLRKPGSLLTRCG
ncbi:hypothetical protein JI735_29295 [Paenibacillus sonchi]|uniref:Uncharacterized protein n=1 Tax=Paenibacillus sonchi TaxID=373687 RepID=A0A974SBL0_9BACL|nr:hypothetical protein [Paenibacillus sonchi]QQZ60538.1 hypothetical protein JI735_29295 [Paenibacillus sonchi]